MTLKFEAMYDISSDLRRFRKVFVFSFGSTDCQAVVLSVLVGLVEVAVQIQ